MEHFEQKLLFFELLIHFFQFSAQLKNWESKQEREESIPFSAIPVIFIKVLSECALIDANRRKGLAQNIVRL